LIPTPTDTEVPTDTPTVIPTETLTPTPTDTEVPTDTPTATPTDTLIPTPTIVVTPIPTVSPTPTLRLTPEVRFSLRVDPDSVDEQGQVRPGDVVVFLMDVENVGAVTVFDTGLMVSVPAQTTFERGASDFRWADDCPDEAGQCALLLGEIAPGQVVSDIRFAVRVAVDGSAMVTLTAHLLGKKPNGDAAALPEAAIQVGVGANAPTALPVNPEEPVWFWYLPIVAR